MTDLRVDSRPIDVPQPAGPDPAQHSQQETQQTQQQAQQNAQQADQQKQAQEAQKAADAQLAQARQAAVDAIKNLPQASLTLPQEFMVVLDQIVQEGYETAQASEGGKTGDQGQEGALGQKSGSVESQRELQMLREFIREAKYLINNQGMEVAQMLNMIKVEQGGAFWQKIQLMLQKGIPLEKMVGFQKAEGRAQEVLRSATPGGEGLPRGSLGAGLIVGVERGEVPRLAILEIIKGELNPQAALENFLGALQALNRGGLERSSERLLSYLRRRGGFSQHEWSMMLKEDSRKDIWQGSMPLEKIKPVTWWYILLAIGIFGASLGIGLNILEATAVGVAMAVLMFLISLAFKK